MIRYFFTLSVHALMFSISVWSSWHLGNLVGRRISPHPLVFWLLAAGFLLHIILSSKHACLRAFGTNNAAAKPSGSRRFGIINPPHIDLPSGFEMPPAVCPKDFFRPASFG